MNNKKKILIISIIALVITLIGSTYAFFMYSKTTKAFTLTSGDIEIQFVNGENKINLTYAYPISDNYAKANLEKLGYVDFSVNGNITEDKKVINYEIYLEEDSKNTLDSNYIKVYLTDDTNKEIVSPKTYNSLDKTSYSNSTNGKVIYKVSKKGEFNDKYRIYVWIDSKYSQNTIQERFSFKVNLYAYNDSEKPKISDVVKASIANHTTESCNPIVTDDNGTLEDASDDTIYFSGTNDCVNFNYVWYSGKLWRIVAINSDGSMKLVTQDEITAISWGEDTAYKDSDKASWIYQWLNEDFKNTLYNYENIIVQNASWNATKDENSIPVRPPTDESATIVQGDVGSLNAYEYYQSYKNLGNYDNGYLNIGYYWWLITSYSDSNVRDVTNLGNFGSDPTSGAAGVRPSINLKSNIESSGEGTKSSPYMIIGDKEPGNSGELINTRLSGEYVKVDNKIYRIVGMENGTTKLTSVDYVRDSGTVLTKNFGSNISWIDSVTSGSDDYWGYYLNNIWLTSKLQNYITEGTYYLGQVGGSSASYNYKNTICSENNTSKPISSCEKTSSTWTGLVGLPRVGEMFSAQLREGYEVSSNIWLITPFSSLCVRTITGNGGSLGDSNPASDVRGARPSINLKSEVIITGGDGMSPTTAYTIGLPSENNKKN